MILLGTLFTIPDDAIFQTLKFSFQFAIFIVRMFLGAILNGFRTNPVMSIFVFGMLALYIALRFYIRKRNNG